MKQLIRKHYSYLTTGVFLLLWTYVFLRAIFVSPIHDETATFFHFIETGKIWGADASLDANNHLLNSFFGRISYKLFGESFFFFRLPNVLCFALYFWGLNILLKKLQPHLKLIVLTGITSIPYILEYFAYTRGYGMSMSFFIWILIFAIRLSNRFSTGNVAGLFFSTFLALLANLSFLSVACLVILLAAMLWMRNLKSLTGPGHIGFAICTAVFISCCSPVFMLGMRMKEAGTLYYGTLDGLWDVTGKTLSKYVLLCDSNRLMGVFLIIIILVLLVQLYNWFQVGLWKFLRSEQGIFSYFFAGALCMMIVMAELLKINYPEDRVAMYLVPLFLLLIAFTIYELKIKWVLFTYLIFPVTLIFHFSLSTSVFTPDERMTESFYNQVKKELQPDQTLSGYPTMELTWALHERKSIAKNFMHLERDFHPTADVVLIKAAALPNNFREQDYEIFAREPEADYLALKRRKASNRRMLAIVSMDENASSGEYIEIAKFDMQDNWKGKRLLITASGKLEREGNTAIETLVISSVKEDGSPFRYEAFDLRWYNTILQPAIPFEMSYEFMANEHQEKEFTVYVWNKYLYPMKLKECKVNVYELEGDE